MISAVYAGWANVKKAALYAGVSVRTFRDWLKKGLPHARLNTRTILVKLTDIDEYLEQFKICDKSNDINEIVNSTLKKIKNN